MIIAITLWSKWKRIPRPAAFSQKIPPPPLGRWSTVTVHLSSNIYCCLSVHSMKRQTAVNVYFSKWFSIPAHCPFQPCHSPPYTQVLLLFFQVVNRLCWPNCRNFIINQQTGHDKPMLIYCWPRFEDDGPTINQHWFSVSCLLGVKAYTPLHGNENKLFISGINVYQCRTCMSLILFLAARYIEKCYSNSLVILSEVEIKIIC